MSHMENICLINQAKATYNYVREKWARCNRMFSNIGVEQIQSFSAGTSNTVVYVLRRVLRI